MLLLREDDRQRAILETVAIEYFAETRRDDAADPKVEQRPDGLLAAGSATEIRPCDQYFGPVERR